MKHMDLVKGMAAGIVVCSLIWVMAKPKKKSCRNVIAKALRSAGDAVENVACAMGL